MKKRRLVCLIFVLGLFALPNTTMGRVLTGYVSIPPVDFNKTGDEAWWFSPELLGTTHTAMYVLFYAPVHLPNEAVITGATLYFQDLSATGYVETELRAVDMPGDPLPIICALASSKTLAQGTSYAESGPLNVTVDNSRKTYSLMLRIYNGDEQSVYQSMFRGYIIQYQYNSATAAVIPMP